MVHNQKLETTKTSLNRWIVKLGYLQSMEYYLAIKTQHTILVTPWTHANCPSLLALPSSRSLPNTLAASYPTPGTEPPSKGLCTSCSVGQEHSSPDSSTAHPLTFLWIHYHVTGDYFPNNPNSGCHTLPTLSCSPFWTTRHPKNRDEISTFFLVGNGHQHRIWCALDPCCLKMSRAHLKFSNVLAKRVN